MKTTYLIFVQAQLGWALAVFQGLFVLGLGLAWVLAIWQWLIGTNPQAAHDEAFQSWLGVFSMVFRMVFGFGLVTLMLVAINWPSLFERTGNVLGPVLLALVVIAFLVKTIFFRVMMHEHGKVSEAVYTFSVLGVAVCYTVVVAGWVVMDVWLRAPVGASLIDGRFQVLDARAIYLNEQVGWQLGMTVMGAVLATVAWLVGRPNRLSIKLYRWFCVLGMLVAVLVLPMAQAALSRLLAEDLTIVSLLTASDLSPALSTGTAIVFALRTIVVMTLFYLVLMVFALVGSGNTASKHRFFRHFGRLPVGLVVLGPMLWASLWLLSYLSKGNDVVVNHLSFADVVNSHSMLVLWMSTGFLLIATLTTLVGLWQSLLAGSEVAKPSIACEGQA